MHKDRPRMQSNSTVRGRFFQLLQQPLRHSFYVFQRQERDRPERRVEQHFNRTAVARQQIHQSGQIARLLVVLRLHELPRQIEKAVTQQVQDDARHAANLREQCAALDTLCNRLFQQRVEAV